MTTPAQQLRRRPDGAKTLIYLDQSTLSDLVSDPAFSSLRDLLSAGVEADQLLCPWSPEHHSETFDAGRWSEMAGLGDELSMGIQLRSDEEMNYSELHAAAAEFSGEPPPGSIWQEAFSADPHTPRESLFPGGFRVSVSFPPGEIDKESTTYTRGLEDERMTAIYAKARELGRTFEQQAECEFDEMVYWRLGPLTDPARFRGDLVRKALVWEQEAETGVVDVSIGSSYGLATSMAERRI